MSFRKVLSFLVVGAAVGWLSSCKSSQDVTESVVSNAAPSATPSTDGSCACEDLACWDKATREGSMKQLNCATDTVATIVPILGPIKDLAMSALYIGDALKAVEALNKGANELINVTERAGVYSPCLRDLSAISASAVGFISKFRDIGEQIKSLKEEETIAKAGPFLKSVFDAASNLIKGINALLGVFVTCETPASKALLKTHYAKVADLKAAAVGPLKALMKPVEDLTKGSAAKLAVIGTIAKCVTGIAEGASTLYKNSMCLRKDLAALEKSKRDVAHALAFVGSRIFNQAKYVGCSECVGDHRTFNTAETNFKTCRSLCEQKAPSYTSDDEPKKRASWVVTCQLTCGTARTEGIFYDSTDVAACAEVLAVGSISRTYRRILLVDADQQGNRLDAVRAARAEALANLKVLGGSFAVYDAAAGGSGDGLIGTTDVAAAAGDQRLSSEQRQAAQFVVDFDYYWFRMLDGASQGGTRDGLVSAYDISVFQDEVSEYRDEAEFE